jgi:hypothetical protein
MNGSWKDLPKAAKRMFVLFGILSLWTVAGPGLVGLSLKMGNDDRWPPENALEWLGVMIGIGGFIFLMLATVISGLIYKGHHLEAAGTKPNPPDRV